MLGQIYNLRIVTSNLIASRNINNFLTNNLELDNHKSAPNGLDIYLTLVDLILFFYSNYFLEQLEMFFSEYLNT